eukprot:6429878-Ditylum_brightwellii.AAC.1
MAVTEEEHIAITQQTANGWEQFFNGRISKKWAQIQDEYLHDVKLHTPRINGTTWAKQAIKLIWQQFFLLWTQQNELCHDKDKCGVKEHQHKIQLAKVEALYLLKDWLLARDKRLMFTSQTDVKLFINTHSAQYIDQWLLIWQPYFCHDIHTATKKAVKKNYSQAILDVRHHYHGHICHKDIRHCMMGLTIIV